MPAAAAVLSLDEAARARHWALAARAGDETAFAELVRTYAGRLLRYLVQMGVAHADAEDLVQETFIRAHRALDRYDQRYAVTTWLYTIGRRLALNHFRDRKSHVALEAVPEPSGAGSVDLDVGGFWQRARELLPPRQYEALWLRYGEERSLADVAEIMAVRPGNAKVLVHRARATLLDQLDPEEWIGGRS